MTKPNTLGKLRHMVIAEIVVVSRGAADSAVKGPAGAMPPIPAPMPAPAAASSAAAGVRSEQSGPAVATQVKGAGGSNRRCSTPRRAARCARRARGVQENALSAAKWEPASSGVPSVVRTRMRRSSPESGCCIRCSISCRPGTPCPSAGTRASLEKPLRAPRSGSDIASTAPCPRAPGSRPACPPSRRARPRRLDRSARCKAANPIGQRSMFRPISARHAGRNVSAARTATLTTSAPPMPTLRVSRMGLNKQAEHADGHRAAGPANRQTGLGDGVCNRGSDVRTPQRFAKILDHQ